jgi:RNA polymerase sigma-54 factor
MSMDLRTGQRQVQALSPRLQHAVRLLQLSSMDFTAVMRDLLGRNPFLEGEEGGDGGDGGDRGEGPAGPDGAPLPASAGTELAAGDAAPEWPGVDDRDLWQAGAGGGLRHAEGAEDGGLSVLDRMEAATTLADHLLAQVGLQALPERALTTARAIIASLDDDGYLRTPLMELVPLVPVQPPATLEDLHLALAVVQSLEPAGVGARDVGECLQLLLPAIACPAARALARRIVEDHLPRLAAHDTPGLAHALGEPVALVDAVCARIRHLDPRPGWRFDAARVDCIVPDVIVRRHGGRWICQLNPAVVPRVRLNQVYAELFKRHRTARDDAMAGQLQEARWTLRNVALRFSTILDVAEAIVQRQHGFLEFGAMAMKPLGLKEIAEAVGIHESTVSRVTNNKYMATPSGVFELKFFFSRVMVSANGSACSGTAIRGLVKDIIAAEQPQAPLSDAEITRQLAQQGLMVARRTVTKYRQQLHIAPVQRRRRCG